MSAKLKICRMMLATAVITAILMTFSGFLNAAPATIPSPERAALIHLENAFASIAEEVEPAVVGITSERKVSSSAGMDSPFNWPFGRLFPWGDDEDRMVPRRPQISGGTGVIIRADGYILTNDHVVGDADKITVKLKDGREFKSESVLRDPEADLALIKINATNLPVAKLGDSDKVRVGQWAIAIGNPFGLSETLTVGVISATGREFVVPGIDERTTRYYPEMLQTDAAINPGNSGGPLVNIHGEVIGINTAIQSTTGTNVGIGFAVPINSAKWSVEQLLKNNKVVRGFIGVMPEEVTPALYESLGTKEGARITSVERGGPADKAGIKVKDVIIKWDGKPVANPTQLRRFVSRTAPNTKVTVVVLRDKKEHTLTVTVGERSRQMASEREAPARLGITVEDLTKEKAERLNIDPDIQGVLVSSVDRASAAALAGVRPRDVIMEINDKKITSASDFDDVISQIKSGDTITMIIWRRDRTVMVTFNVD